MKTINQIHHEFGVKPGLKHLVLGLVLAAVCLAVPPVFAANITKASAGTSLTAGASWTGSTAPASGDVAIWDTSSLGAGLTLSSGTPSWLGIKVNAGASDPISIASGGTLTNGTSGIDMSASAINATISSGLTIGAGSQTWNIATGKTFTQNTGTFTRNAGATLLIDKSSNTGTVTPNIANYSYTAGWARWESACWSQEKWDEGNVPHADAPCRVRLNRRFDNAFARCCGLLEPGHESSLL